MPLSACSSGLVVTALVALLLLPAQYYVPPWQPGEEASAPADEAPAAGGLKAELTRSAAPSRPATLPSLVGLDLVYFPTLDILFTFSLLLLGFFTYLCEWVQRKLMERRIVKLNQYLGASVERLRAWDVQQEQVEMTLRTAQNATSEYNLLMYLLLRQHRCLARQHHGPSSNCFFDKDPEEDLNFLRSPTLNA